MYIHNSKKNIDFHSRDKVSMLEVAAYIQTRRQIQSRGYAGNFDIGFVTPGASLTPEQVEQSKVSKFKPGTAIQMGAIPGKAAAANDWYEVHQVKWTRKALSEVSDFTRTSCRWLEENPG